MPANLFIRQTMTHGSETVLLGGSVKLVCTSECKKSREVAASLPDQFLSRRCFTLCITMDAEPRIAKQYKCHHCRNCKKNTGKRGKRVEKKCLCVVFWLTRRSRVRGKKSVWGHPMARATNYCLLPDTLWLRASKNAFTVGSVKFTNSLSPPSIVKEERTRSKSSQGT